MVVQREKAGRTISTADAQIAAICAAHGARLATRNIPDFALLDLQLINPWD
jgi:predicted nucleic acid-binding protein